VANPGYCVLWAIRVHELPTNAENEIIIALGTTRDVASLVQLEHTGCHPARKTRFLLRWANPKYSILRAIRVHKLPLNAENEISHLIETTQDIAPIGQLEFQSDPSARKII
jgi:hypothetical protein